MKKTITLGSEADTDALAHSVGQRLKGNECIELISDLGGGKTTFTRGLAAGSGSTDSVGSPTFTIMKQYDAPQFSICHYDFYRLDDAGLVGEELSEALQDEHVVTVIEWAQTVHSVLPARRLQITLLRTPDSETARKCRIECPVELDYLFERVL